MNKNDLPLREKDGDLLTYICEKMNAQGRADLMEKYKVSGQSELSSRSEAYHFKYYKDKYFNGVQQDKLHNLLKKRGSDRGIEIVNRLPTETSTSPKTARIIFECFADARGISQPECLLEFLELCNNENRPLDVFENDQSGFTDTIEDLKKYIAESKNETKTGTPETTTIYRYNIERVEGAEKWLDPYNFDELPLVGRKNECELLDQFIEIDDQFKIWAISGPSGSGKTRLACQWAYDLDILKNWDCRVLHKEDRSNPELWANWSPDKPTLIIIDYLYGFEKVVLKLMSHRLKPTDTKVRLLLIDHVFSAPLHSDKRWGFSGDGSSLNRNEKYFFDLKPLDLQQTQDQAEIIQSIIAHRAGIDEKSTKVSKAHNYLLELEKKGQRAYHPLFAALIGNAIKSGEDFKTWNRRELINYYLSGDRLPWKHGSDEGRWASYFIAAATARRGITYENLYEAIRNDISTPEYLSDVEEICQKVISDHDEVTLAPFEPDILGESFFLQLNQFLQIPKYKKYKNEFQQVLIAGDEDTQIKDAIELIAFIQRLTRNLLNDDPNHEETQKLWKALFEFINPSDFDGTEPIKWALTAGLIDITDAIKDQFPKETLITLLSQADPAVLYHVHDPSRLSASVVHSMRHFELTSQLAGLSPSLYEKMANLFDRYTASKVDEDTPLMIASYYGFNEIVNLLISREKMTETFLADVQNSLITACAGGQVVIVKQLINAGANIIATDGEELTALVAASFLGHVEVVELLLDKGAQTDVALGDGSTALHFAVHSNHIEIVRLLLNKHADINATNNDGQTALIWAIANSHMEIFKLLFDKGADINIADNDGGTALLYAIIKGHVDVARLLLDEGANINIADNDARTPLIWASAAGFIEIVRLLLDKGVDIEASDNKNRTPLFYAVSKGHVDVVKLLLGNRARIDTTDIQGIKILIEASAAGFIEMVKLLLDKGIDIETVDIKGKTPLIWASIKGHVDIVRLLLDEGADINVADNDSNTALLYAINKGHVDVVKLLLDNVDIHPADSLDYKILIEASALDFIEMVRLLLDKGIDIETTDIKGKTPLIWASIKGHVDVVRLLLDEGADINIADNDGRTALIWASINEHLEVAELLLDKEANIETSDNDNRTALVWTCIKGNVEIARMLLDKKAGVNIVDKEGLTALIWACENRHLHIINLLLDKGAKINAVNKDGLSALHWMSVKGIDVETPLSLDVEVDIDLTDYEGNTEHFRTSTGSCIEIIELLLDKEANIDAVDGKNRTPLIWACINGHTDIAKLLIDKEAGINVSDNGGRTALIWASLNGHVDIVKLLLNKEVNIDATDDNGRTALISACFNGHIDVINTPIDFASTNEEEYLEFLYNENTTELTWVHINGHVDVVRILLDKGADIDAIDNDGRTAIISAAHVYDNIEIIRLLLKQKSRVDIVDNKGQTALSVATEKEYEGIVKLLVEHDKGI